MEFILPNKQILLSPLGNTNDPRENKGFAFGTISDGSVSWQEVSKDVSNYLKENHKLTCFSQDAPPLFGYEYSRMWSQYGGDHKGVCLLLDKAAFLKENALLIRSGYFRVINYKGLEELRSIRPMHVDVTKIESMGMDRYMKELFIPSCLEFLFFIKNQEWSSENEIRLLLESSKEENEYCSIKNSLRHIYLGVDFNKVYLSSIIKLSPDADISILEYTGTRLYPLLSYDSEDSKEKQP